MELKGKNLLLMGGGAYAKGIQQYKDEKSFRIVALGRDANTPIARIADAFLAPSRSLQWISTAFSRMRMLQYSG